MGHQYLALDAKAVQQQIEQLLMQFPELAEDEQLLADMIEGETDLESVAKRALEAIATATELITGIRERESSLKERRARFERQAEAMKALIQKVMDAARQDKLVLPEATISITKGRQSVEVTDADALPQGYFATIRQPDKKAIGAALKAGEEIPGAALVTGQPSLSIRSK